MPLDTSAVSVAASDKFKDANWGAFHSSATLVGHALRAVAAPPPPESKIRRRFFPLDESKFASPTAFFNELNTYLGSHPYCIFKDNEEVLYVVIPQFELSRTFEIHDVPTASRVSATIQELGENNPGLYLLAGYGPWHSLTRVPYGPIYIDGNQVAGNSGFGRGFLQYEPPNAINGFSANFTIGEGEADGNNGASGYSQLPPLILDQVYIEGNDRSFISGSEIDGDPTCGGQIFAYHKSRDMLFLIMRKDGEGAANWEMKRITDMLLFLGFDDAVFLDGSDSVYLVEYDGSGGRTELVSSLKSYAISFGTKDYQLDYFYAIK